MQFPIQIFFLLWLHQVSITLTTEVEYGLIGISGKVRRKLCPPGGESFLDAYYIACPMRHKRTIQPRTTTFRELLDLCCSEGCNLVELHYYCGVPRSGTTLMRAILDTHASIRCGEETRVIPRILGLQKSWRKSDKELLRLEEAKISESVIDTAVSAFIMHIMIGHGPAAERICNKDPLVLKYSVYLSKLFPNSKFLLMVRDGRATVHSIISRKVTITGFDLDVYRQCLMKWNIAISTKHEQCLEVGESRCMMVYYEQLVLHPRKEMERILKFLDLPWKDSVLHHQDFIGSAISLSKVEKSTDQVIKPINTDALTSWYGHIPENVARDISVIAPMLKTLGYDTSSNRPNYGNADQMVIDNTANLHNSNINSGRPMSDNLNPKISLFR